MVRWAADRGQLGLQTILAAFVLVIAVSVGIIVVDEIDQSDNLLDGETITVTNESVSALNFTGDDTHFYEVSKNGSSDVSSFNDDEQVFNTTSDVELTEATDYEWFPDNGTVRIDNTTETDDGATDIVITYTYVETTSDLGGAENSVVGGFADMTSLIGPLLLIAIGLAIIGLIRRVQ